MPLEMKKVCMLEGHEWQCSSVDFHPAANMIVSGGWDRTIRIWDVEDELELRLIDRTAHQGPVTCVRWHPNGALLASTSSDNTTCLWDASTGEKMRVLREHFGWVLQCSFAPDRTKLATASWDKTVRLWDPNTGELISTLRSHTKGVHSCEFFPVGHTSALLATAGEDATAKLWDTRTRKVALTLSGGHVDAIHSITWSNDGSLIATGSADRNVTIWDPKAGKILRLLKAHEDAVKSCVFAPINSHNSSNILATAGGYSAFVWNPNLPSNNLLSEASYHAPGKEVEAVSISYDGRLMATGGRDGKICITEMPEYRNDKFDGIDPSTRRQTKAAESWLKGPSSAPRRSSVSVPTIKPEGIKRREDLNVINRAMQDESASWLQRRQQYENNEISEEKTTVKPTRTNPNKLLAARGFQQDGQLNTDRRREISFIPDDFREEEEEEKIVDVDDADSMEFSGFGDDIQSPSSTNRPPLRKTSMLDETGKVHPMIAAARGKEVQKNRPAAQKLDNVDSLMALLREKTESSTVSTVPSSSSQEKTVPKRLTSKDSSVEALLDFSKPKLDHRPRMKTKANLFEK